MRCTALCIKCDPPELENMSDYQILEQCLQCLTPGMKYDEKHTSYKKYVCPDSYDKRFPKGLHVLVCEAHRKKQPNIVYKKEVKKFENFIKNISLML